MADFINKKVRSEIMSRIRSRNTKPELTLKKELRGLGFLYQPKIIGRPDFANKKKKVAIFVHGCFWHKCPRHYKAPKSNQKYWLPKIQKNIERDKKSKMLLSQKKYKVIIIWEHELKNCPSKCLATKINKCLA